VARQQHSEFQRRLIDRLCTRGPAPIIPYRTDRLAETFSVRTAFTIPGRSNLKPYYKAIPVICALLIAVPLCSWAQALSDAQVARELVRKDNKLILEQFLKYELNEVNEYAARPLIGRHPSLEFFIKQADRGPLDSLLFLETQVHKLIDAQDNIDKLPYSISFSAAEKKKIMGLRPAAHKIVSYGIPLMKRDFYRVVTAVRKLAAEKKRNPLKLLPDPRFRDAVYRECAETAKTLDYEMGKLSEGELISMRLGWTLETVTVTRIWLLVNDNRLPKQDDYMVFRKKRSEYFQRRLKRIYGNRTSK
jgi:hypothetical protein